jgi:hypothetical protein
MDNRNNDLFEALRKVETSSSSTPVSTGSTFMSVADFKANNPEGEVDVRQVTEGDKFKLNTKDVLNFIRFLLKAYGDITVKDISSLAQHLDEYLALYTQNAGMENSMKYGEARPLAQTIINKLVENERLDSIEELVEGFDDSKEFMDSYLETFLDLFDSYGVSPEDEEDVLSAILDVLSDYTMWFEVED